MTTETSGSAAALTIYGLEVRPNRPRCLAHSQIALLHRRFDVVAWHLVAHLPIELGELLAQSVACGLGALAKNAHFDVHVAVRTLLEQPLNDGRMRIVTGGRERPLRAEIGCRCDRPVIGLGHAELDSRSRLQCLEDTGDRFRSARCRLL